MNILVIGNGFDLAHELPTKYIDFLKFIDVFNECLEKERSGDTKWGDDDLEIKEYLRVLFDRANEKSESPEQNPAKQIVDELVDLIKNNVWLKYFKQVQIKEGWIDFESEISKIIQALDDARKTLEEQYKQGEEQAKMEQRQLNVLNPFFSKDGSVLKNDMIFFSRRSIEYKKTQFLNDLNKMIRCLEIYLCDYVGNIKISKKLPDIEGLPYLDKVLSFNYTNTYEKIYTKNPAIEYDYIHGKAKLENTIKSNNMVLGIDEYLKGDEKNENVEMIEFKKFYQRIHKETGCLYRNWVEIIETTSKIEEIISIVKRDGKSIFEKRNTSFHNVFFFGHSLDITDKDVIRDLILADKVRTTIFYRNKADYGQKIANLVKIIGQDQVISRTGGREKSLFFKEISS